MQKTEYGPKRASFTVYLKRMISRYLPYASALKYSGLILRHISKISHCYKTYFWIAPLSHPTKYPTKYPAIQTSSKEIYGDFWVVYLGVNIVLGTHQQQHSAQSDLPAECSDANSSLSGCCDHHLLGHIESAKALWPTSCSCG